MPRKGAFKRCVESVGERGGVSDPRAVCAASIAGKRGRTRGRVNAGKTRRPGTKDLQDLATTAVKAKLAPWALVGNPKKVKGPQYVVRSGDSTRFFSNIDQALKYINGLKRAGTFDGERIEKFATNPRSRKNHHNEPAAIEAYKDFHGREPEELLEFETKTHYPGRTAAIGELISLKIRVPAGRVSDGGRVVTVKNFNGAMLTRHPSKVQLYVEGGDQSLDLDEFGLSNSDAHEVEYLGHLVEVTYYTVKDHLGREGGEANYVHKFGVNEATAEKTECPRVNYRVADEQIEFSGGGYTIPSEGIDG